MIYTSIQNIILQVQSLVDNKDENIGNHEYIENIQVNILKKNIDRLKINQNLWKYKKNFVEM